MTQRLQLESGEAFVEVLPLLGGAIGAFDAKVGAARLPIFRAWTGEWEDPRAYASSPIVPWFNRIKDGGFTFRGKFYPIAPNDPMDAFPLHGDGWRSPWDVVEQTAERGRLRLRSKAIPPYDYEALQTITLSGATLDIALSVENCGPETLPFGLGQHPWFIRTPAVTLHAPATGVWLEQPPEFPESPVAAPLPDEWDFNRPRHLPDGFFDNGFAGWNGRARIDWPDRGLACAVEADAEAKFYHVYSKGADCPYFCFEPVTHENNALAKPGTPEENGLRVLNPGERTALRASFRAIVA